MILASAKTLYIFAAIFCLRDYIKIKYFVELLQLFCTSTLVTVSICSWFIDVQAGGGDCSPSPRVGWSSYFWGNCYIFQQKSAYRAPRSEPGLAAVCHFNHYDWPTAEYLDVFTLAMTFTWPPSSNSVCIVVTESYGHCCHQYDKCSPGGSFYAAVDASQTSVAFRLSLQQEVGCNRCTWLTQTGREKFW